MTATMLARPTLAFQGPRAVFSVSSAHCVHGFAYAGAAKAPKPGSACVRPSQLACTRCGFVCVVDCQSTRTETCEPCGTVYRDRVRRIARVPEGAVLLVTITAPGGPGHKHNVGGRRVRRQGKDGKWHVDTVGGRWEDCDCWRNASHEHSESCDPDGCTVQDWEAWNAGASALFNRLWNNGVRRADGSTVRTGPNAGTVRDDLSWLHGAYFRATEPQQRGALHFHLLVRVDEGFHLTDAHVDALQHMAVSFGFGHVLDVEVVEGHRGAGYVAKYVSKGANERAKVPWRRLRCVRVARDRLGLHYGSERLPVREMISQQGMHLRLLVPRQGPLTDGHEHYVSHRATYRTWTSSRDWPLTMRRLRQAQEHYAALMAVLPSWDRPADGWHAPLIVGCAHPSQVATLGPDVPDDDPPKPPKPLWCKHWKVTRPCCPVGF